MINHIDKIVQKNMLVSVIFALEGDSAYASKIFQNLRQQTYKNVEYIFSHMKQFNIEDFKTKIYEETDLDITVPVNFIEVEDATKIFDDAISQASGEIIFFKTCNPIIWNDNHILSHLDIYNEKPQKQAVVLSLVETKDIEKNENDPSGTIGYRLNKKIAPNDLLIDEISFMKDVNINVGGCFEFLDARGNRTDKETAHQKMFSTEKLYNEIVAKSKSVQFANEISVILFIQNPQKQNQNYVLTQPDYKQLNTIQEVADIETLEIRDGIPTIFGNKQLDEQWNTPVKALLSKHWNTINGYKDKRVIIKRTIGMGDVIQAEPIVRFFKSLGFEVWFVTSMSRGCNQIVKYFDSKPDYILEIEEQEMTKDMLGENNLRQLLQKNFFNPDDFFFDLRIDLDLSYESHFPMPFVKAYFETFNVPEIDLEEYCKQIDCYTPKLIPAEEQEFKNYVSVSLAGSGWQSKMLNANDVEYILSKVKDKHILQHTSQLEEFYKASDNHFSAVNDVNDFATMMKMIYNSKGYIGADNGSMHVALAYNKPVFIWNGAALTTVTTQHHDKNLYTILKKDLECLGCKHRMFYNIVPVSEKEMSLTFLPTCENQKEQYECMSSFDKNIIDNTVNEFMNKIV